MATILLSVAYDGAAYSGAASQRNAITVADTLRRALLHLDEHISLLRIVSRTDAGVHARDQKVAFDTQRKLPTRAWVLGLAKYLPDDIVVLSAARVPDGFTPRFAARGKLYRYLLYGALRPDPFRRRRVWHIAGIHTHVDAIHQALQPALGDHDFSGFSAAADSREHKRCILTRAACQRIPHEPESLAIDIEGDRFVYNMVRILVGTAVDAGRGRAPADAISQALASGQRRHAGVTAPAHGLYLQRADLDVIPHDSWPPKDDPPD